MKATTTARTVARGGDGAQVPILEHILGLLAEMDQRYLALHVETDLRYQQRYESQQKAMEAAFVAQETAMRAALASAEKAVTAALAAAELAVRTALEAAKESVSTAQNHTEIRFSEITETLRVLSERAPLFTQLAEQITALDRLTDAKFTTLRTVVDSEAEKVALAMKAADKAALLLAESTTKRFESVNEFRGTLTDQAAGFTTRIEFQTARDALIERVQELTASSAGNISRGEFAALAKRVDQQEGHGRGLNAGWIYLLGGLGAVGTITSLVIAAAVLTQ